ncbi:hypothetical protein BGW41_003690 [Actinomortierella wolfii]|nr:hypothetical protein BGW41_003690 [Actinomortierella wolfii]
MSMGEFMDAHVNHQSMRNDKPVPTFFYPSSCPSGPDLVFSIYIGGGRKVVPVFVQMKLHHSSAKLYKSVWNKALATVSAPCIEDCAKDFQNFYSNIYISIVVAYPMMCAPKLPPVIEVPVKDELRVQQVVINMSARPTLARSFPRSLSSSFTGSRTWEN